MKFRTEITCSKASHQITHNSHIVLFGSCFSEHMVDKFDYFKFNHFSNPFGILFNPIAIQTAVEHCVSQSYYTEENLVFEGDIWLSLNHHSQFNNRKQEVALTDINAHIKNGHHALKKATHVIITLGTSWVYRWNETGQTVGNCHKISQKKFTKSILSLEEVSNSLANTISQIRSINKDVTIIFTLSPVRHVKDGFTENSLSKAILLQAIHHVINENDTFYFPAYEIMMDDLRDYRFYNDDLLHPNNLAVNYIWNLFTSSWISDASLELMGTINDIQKSLAHRPFDPDSKAHQKFLEKLNKKIVNLQKTYPQIEFHKKRKC